MIETIDRSDMRGFARELLGWEFALRCRAKEAERAIEEACIARRFRAACRDYRLAQDLEPGELDIKLIEGAAVYHFDW
jgi:hypothetical protein